MNGLLITNAFAKNENIRYQAEEFVSQFAYLGVELVHKTNIELFAYINKEGNIETTLGHFDFILYFDKDKYIGNMLEKSGYSLVNPMRSIELCDDKMLTHIALANHGIKMPKTLSYPLCYEYNNNFNEFLPYILNNFKFPFLIKENFGSLGKQVYMISGLNDLLEKEKMLRYKPHIYQEYVSSSFGVDYRLVVIGKKVVTSMKRVNVNNYVSNIGSGGVGEIYYPDEKMKDMAVKAANILGLEYCGIDFVIDENNEPVIIEVNSNAFFKEINKVTGSNVGKTFCEYIINKYKK